MKINYDRTHKNIDKKENVYNAKPLTYDDYLEAYNEAGLVMPIDYDKKPLPINKFHKFGTTCRYID